MYTLHYFSRHARRQRHKPQENIGQSQEGKVSGSGKVGKVQAKIIEFKIPVKTFEVMYLTGETLLSLVDPKGAVPFDTDGTPVLTEEFYEVTDTGIRRVA